MILTFTVKLIFCVYGVSVIIKHIVGHSHDEFVTFS